MGLDFGLEPGQDPVWLRRSDDAKHRYNSARRCHAVLCFSHRIHRSSFQVPFIENAISLEDRGVKCPVGCELATNITNNHEPLCPLPKSDTTLIPLPTPLKNDEWICEGWMSISQFDFWTFQIEPSVALSAQKHIKPFLPFHGTCTILSRSPSSCSLSVSARLRLLVLVSACVSFLILSGPSVCLSLIVLARLQDDSITSFFGVTVYQSWKTLSKTFFLCLCWFEDSEGYSAATLGGQPLSGRHCRALSQDWRRVCVSAQWKHNRWFSVLSVCLCVVQVQQLDTLTVFIILSIKDDFYKKKYWIAMFLKHAWLTEPFSILGNSNNFLVSHMKSKAFNGEVRTAADHCVLESKA